ncbi:hypothetical protein BH18GEM1_BH18GEM1_23310 [soil metagenome]
MTGVRRLLSRLAVNEVRTRGTPAYPDIQPLALPLDPQAAFDAAVEAARSMPRWTVIESSSRDRSLRVEARTRLLRFTDDVWIWIEAAGGGASRVQVRSRSRVGIWDLGTNARRVRAYFARIRGPGAQSGSCSAWIRGSPEAS